MKVALVTGGAGAVGAATARMLAEDGFAVTIADLEGTTNVCRYHIAEALSYRRLNPAQSSGGLRPTA